ncbi:hypothetical protein TeGR_g742, partial [Tetraparma gracilis]
MLICDRRATVGLPLPDAIRELMCNLPSLLVPARFSPSIQNIQDLVQLEVLAVASKEFEGAVSGAATTQSNFPTSTLVYMLRYVLIGRTVSGKPLFKQVPYHFHLALESGFAGSYMITVSPPSPSVLASSSSAYRKSLVAKEKRGIPSGVGIKGSLLLQSGAVPGTTQVEMCVCAEKLPDAASGPSSSSSAGVSASGVSRGGSSRFGGSSNSYDSSPAPSSHMSPFSGPASSLFSKSVKGKLGSLPNMTPLDMARRPASADAEPILTHLLSSVSVLRSSNQQDAALDAARYEHLEASLASPPPLSPKESTMLAALKVLPFSPGEWYRVPGTISERVTYEQHMGSPKIA